MTTCDVNQFVMTANLQTNKILEMLFVFCSIFIQKLLFKIKYYTVILMNFYDVS